MNDLSRTDTIRRPSLLLLGALTAIDAVAIDSYIPALPAIQADFDADAAAVQSTLAIFFLGLAVGQAVWGPISDRFGRRWPIILGLIAYTFASLLAALSPTLPLLLAARFIQAIGASAGLVLARAVVSDLWPREEAARLYTIMMQVLGASTLISPLLGGGLLIVASWRAIFLLMAVLGLASLLWTWPTLGESLPRERRSLRAASWFGSYSTLFGRPPFVCALIGVAFSMGSMFAIIAGSSFIFIRQFGWSSTAFAVFYAATSICFLLICQLNGALLRRMSSISVLKVGLATQSILAILFLASVLAGWNAPVWYAILITLLLSVLGLIFGNGVAQAMRYAPVALGGTASGAIGVAQFLLSAAITPLASVLPDYALGVAAVSLLCAVVACAGAFAAEALGGDRDVEG